MTEQESSSDPPRPPRKDRLIQTRVPRDLEATLKEEARRRRLTVSHLIRNVLEDAFELVDGVVADVDQIVTDSVSLAKNVSRNARRLASSARVPETPASQPTSDLSDISDISHVYAWNEVVLHQSASCSSCGTQIERGERGFAGMSDTPERPRAWLCPACCEAL
ncbi:MAG: hypothetical protein JRG96_06920 [Deltaproteobacteria bacterium]|nr:hypothetical protein [Deltaproteobacteria bacterium]MBW2418617.1 hypothetical protein [Deltaproteobacteria bacterium]